MSPSELDKLWREAMRRAASFARAHATFLRAAHDPRDGKSDPPLTPEAAKVVSARNYALAEKAYEFETLARSIASTPRPSGWGEGE